MRFADHLSEEIARLEAELEALPAYQMLKALKVAAAVAPKVYGPPSPAQQQSSPPSDNRSEDEEVVLRSPSGRRLDPARQKALEATLALLKGKAEPTRTADIYESIVALGIALGGAEPQNNLSALLTRSGLFDSHGRKGWTLKGEGGSEVEEGEGEDDDDLGFPVSPPSRSPEDHGLPERSVSASSSILEWDDPPLPQRKYLEEQ